MERKLCFRSLANSHITAMIYQPLRREVVAGHEDGSLRCWEQDSGKLVSVSNHHKGWITGLLFWPEGKTLFSASIDYTIVQWSPSGAPFNTIDLGSPIYSLVWNPREDGLFCGRDGFITLLTLSGKNSSSGLPLLSRKETRVDGHYGIIKCLATSGSKVYSAGYDNILVVWEVSTMPGDGGPPLRPIVTHRNAHNAGITSIVVARDTDNSIWLATGSFDSKCKLWTGDGKLMFQLQCAGPVTGLCYVPHTGVLWVAAGTSLSYYEPKSGECITDVVPVLNNRVNFDKNRFIQQLKYIPETNEVMGSTNMKEVVVWRYTASCSLCIHQSPSHHAHIETIAYTNKRPILMFTGTHDGIVTKWERLQLNPFMYSTEQLHYKDCLAAHLVSKEAEWNLVRSVFGGEFPIKHDGPDQPEAREATRKLKDKARKKLLETDYRGFVCSLFVNELDYLVCSCLDGRIMVWGYDMKTVAVLTELQRKTSGLGNGTKDSGELTTNPSDTDNAVINRVAGFTCLHILNGHTSCGSGLELVQWESHPYLVSAGWDSTVCVWDLITGELLAKIQHNDTPSDDDIITCLAYSPTTNCIAYSMSDCVTYLKKFSARQSEIILTGKLEGHTDEVTQVRWNSFIEKWVTASEDGTIRIWKSEGGKECEQLVSVGKAVSLITIDRKHGLILAAVHNIIMVYNSNLEKLLECRGHEDSVRAILHIPENDQYVTAGWDNSLRIWPAYQPRSR